MAIVELDLLSGYSADRDTLNGLTKSSKAPLYDIDGDRVIIYFNQVSLQL